MKQHEFREFKEYVTQNIITLKQNHAELLEMKDTMYQMKSSMESLSTKMSQVDE